MSSIPDRDTSECTSYEADGSPEVSVIVPVYNGKEHIPNIIRFLDEQVFRDFETVFVVDSNSTDGSEDIARNYVKNGRNVKVIIQRDDEKLGGARNIGIDNSVGRLVWFLDVDDRPHPAHMEELVRIQRENDSDVTACNFVYVDSVNGKLPREKDGYVVKIMGSDEALRLRSMERFPVTAWSSIFKRDMLDRNGLRFENSYAEDIKFMYKALSYSSVICYYERPLYLYVEQPRSRRKGDGVDLHGMAEIESYNDLAEYFSDGDFNKLFRKRSSLLRIRSSGHLNYDSFIKYAKSRECREMIERDLSDPVCPEAVWYRLFPSTYYMVIQVFFKLIYYRNGRKFAPGRVFRK